MTRYAQWTARFGLAVLVVTATVLGLLICEIALRLLRPGENLLTTATLGIYAPDPELGWVNRRDFTDSRDWAGRKVLIRTDAEGRRVPSGHVQTGGAAQIAFGGDSYVFGNEVNAEETFVYLFGEASQTRTVNLGVGGYSLSQECLALRRFLAQKTSIAHVLLVIYVGNDIEYGIYPPKTRRVDEYGYLRDASPGRWTDIRSFALRNSQLAFYLQIAWRRLRPVASKSSAAVLVDTPYRWIYDEVAFTGDRLNEHQRALASLRDDARVRGVPVTVVLMPEKDQIYGSLSDLPNRMLSLTLSHLGMPVVDLLPAMRRVAAERPPLWHDIVEGHLSPEGHRLVADILMAQL